MCEPNHLKNEINNIKWQNPQNIRTLVLFENELESNRTEYLKSWTESISQLREKLRNLKSEVRNDFTMEVRDAQYYRVNMFQLEAKISEIKENIKNELFSLLKEECELNREIQVTERRVEDWAKPLNSNILKPAINSIYRIESQEVKSDPAGEFQKFLSSSGGHCGGWEEHDHLLFLRERRKCSGKSSKFLAVLQSLLPDVRREEIEAHEKWYQKYVFLKNLQREAIRKWRASKSTFNENSDLIPEQKDSTKHANKTKNVTYQRDIAERIKEWKRQQELRKIEQEEREKKEMQSQAEERLRKREAQKAKKLAIEQYKAEKVSKMQEELLASRKMKEVQAIEEKARKNLLLKAFREHDKQYIERIKYLRSQSASKGKEKIEKLENVKPAFQIMVERDRRRLLKPTHVWNQHCLPQENDIDRKFTKIMNLQAIPHLAIPSWRKGLSNI